MSIKGLLIRILIMLTTEELSATWGKAGYFNIWKCGRVVTISIWNPQSLPNGSTSIMTLPEGWRPKHDIAFNVYNPNSFNMNLRYTVYANGAFSAYVYNTAISGSSNASTCFSYVTA